jgi:hypothetical protein
MHFEGVSHHDAHEWLAEIWPHYAKTNEDFTIHLNEISFMGAVYGRGGAKNYRNAKEAASIQS